MTTTAQFDIGSLLEQTGARPRGNRHDCPKCGGCRTVTHTDECFYCHKCQWRGNVITLAKELEIYQPLPDHEYTQRKRERERVRDAAERLCAAVKARRTELLEALSTLSRIEAGAHRWGPGKPTDWDALEMVYRDRPGTLAELAFLENADARALFRFLADTPNKRQAALEAILVQGGMYDYAGKFIEVSP